ncbi:hypothetical protein V1478_013831 [Vespula squamosa]|uniref:Uncharacterized protein n=1 Tax=Vespula squamosa TaxID=30214 RepID=A0ABD2A8P2_VESSQ
MERKRNPREVLALQFEMVEIRNKEPTRIAKWGRGSGDRELNILCATLKVGERRRALVKESDFMQIIFSIANVDKTENIHSMELAKDMTLQRARISFEMRTRKKNRSGKEHVQVHGLSCLLKTEPRESLFAFLANGVLTQAFSWHSVSARKRVFPSAYRLVHLGGCAAGPSCWKSGLVSADAIKVLVLDIENCMVLYYAGIRKE